MTDTLETFIAGNCLGFVVGYVVRGIIAVCSKREEEKGETVKNGS